MRLAEWHSVTVGDLVEGVIWPASGWPERKKRPFRGFDKFGHLDGAGQVAREWVELLQKLTGRNDLRYLTLLSAAGVARFDGAGRNQGARCIECIREEVESGRPCYEQLCWALGDYKLCLKHIVLVAERCAVCGSEDLGIVRKTTRVGCCGKCGAWMGGPAFHSAPSSGATRYRLAVSAAVSDLLAMLNDPKLASVDGTAVFEYAAKIAFEGNYAEMARCIDMPKSTLSEMLSRRTKPRFDKLLALSVTSGVPIKRLLFGSLTGRRVSVSQLRKPIEVSTKTLRKRRPQLDVAAAEAELRKALRRVRAISLTAVAERLGTSRRVLHTHARELSNQVVRRFSQQRRERSEARYESACKRIMRGVSICVLDGEFPTVRRISELLGPVTVQEANRDFYRQTLRKYGLEGKGNAPEPVRANVLKEARRILVEENLQSLQ